VASSSTQLVALFGCSSEGRIFAGTIKRLVQQVGVVCDRARTKFHARVIPDVQNDVGVRFRIKFRAGLLVFALLRHRFGEVLSFTVRVAGTVFPISVPGGQWLGP